MDDRVPGRKRGRPDCIFEKGPALVSDQGVSRKCAKCPKYELSKLWCPLRAETRHPITPACRYGIVLIEAARQKEYRNGRGEKEAGCP